MSIDYSAALDDPIYVALGVPATLTSSASVVASVTAIDNTDGYEISENLRGMALETIKPAALVRMSEVTAAGIDVAALSGGTIEMNTGAAGAKTWVIESYRLQPNPAGGELSGEVALILSEQ